MTWRRARPEGWGENPRGEMGSGWDAEAAKPQRKGKRGRKRNQASRIRVRESTTAELSTARASERASERAMERRRSVPPLRQAFSFIPPYDSIRFHSLSLLSSVSLSLNGGSYHASSRQEGAPGRQERRARRVGRHHIVRRLAAHQHPRLRRCRQMLRRMDGAARGGSRRVHEMREEGRSGDILMPSLALSLSLSP